MVGDAFSQAGLGEPAKVASRNWPLDKGRYKLQRFRPELPASLETQSIADLLSVTAKS
jgi:hypothetical protein